MQLRAKATGVLGACLLALVIGVASAGPAREDHAGALQRSLFAPTTQPGPSRSLLQAECITADDCGGAMRGDCANGTCVCEPAYQGENCGSCLADTHGPDCDRGCVLGYSCSGHGRCSGLNGTCLCDEWWTGSECEISEAQMCSDSSDCGGGGRGTCVEEICVCEPGYQGGHCEVCPADRHGPNCSSVCSLATSCGDHGRCSGVDGTCLCDEGWTGEECEIGGTPTP